MTTMLRVLLLAALVSLARVNADQQKSLLLVSVPLPGHIHPLLGVGREAQRRGWSVTLATMDEMRPRFGDEWNFASLGNLSEAQTQSFAHYQRHARSLIKGQYRGNPYSDEWLQSTQHSLSFFRSVWSTMYRHLLAHVQVTRPSFIIADCHSWAGSDVAHQLRIPFAWNNADMLGLMPPDLLPPFDFVPSLLFHKSPAEMSLTERLVFPALRTAAHLFSAEMQRTEDEPQSFQEMRDAVDASLPPFDYMNVLYANMPVLVNSAFPLEYNRPLPPLVHMTGPMLAQPSSPVPQLAGEVATWVEGTSKPVVYVSMGSLVQLNRVEIAAFARALSSDSFDVLWKLNGQSRKALDALSMSLPPSIHVTKWLPSQFAVLAHRNVKVFVSHCGINSAHESIVFGTAVLCIPMFGDQRDMARRIKDSGAGSFVDQLPPSSSPADQEAWSVSVSSAIQALLDPAKHVETQATLRRLQAAFRLAGGASKAMDVIEFTEEFGADSLVMANFGQPLAVRLGWDVFAVNFVVLALLVKLFAVVSRCCCCQFCHRASPGKDKIE